MSTGPETYGLLGGVAVLALAMSKAFSRIFRLSNTTLEKDFKRVTAERDQEREEKHQERTKRVAAELALHVAKIDFDGFLQKKGIDPREFVLSEAKKIETGVTKDHTKSRSEEN